MATATAVNSVAPITNAVSNLFARNYAKSVNAKYKTTNKANNISWIDRWNQTLAKYPTAQQNQIRSRLNAALKKFSKNHQGIKSFQDRKFRLCKALTKKLTTVLIDTTIQRELDLNWVIHIIETFRPYQAQPLQIYKPLPQDMPDGFDGDQEAIDFANSTSYGLAFSVWTSNVTRAHSLAAKLKTGIVWVNCWMLRDLRTPFGGVKQSGVGREGGWEALRFFTEAKNVCVKI